MTILQHSSAMPLSADSIWLACGARALRTRRSGWLTVAVGRAWVTRQGDLDDHVLSAGERLALRADERVVIEPWTAGSSVRVAWRGDPRHARALRALDRLLAVFFGAAATGLAALGARASAWARSAEASANRAHGSIARGESSASSGALQ
jgi:Protein of unknown function (DUF2917)